jgi:rare lipoprotein A
VRVRLLLMALLIFVVYGCATTAPQPKIEEILEGIASWYGEEFAGKTTANGEIFDPMQLTAAHRTLPFGTLLEVTNPKTNQSVRVRVNDRGPYVGNRVLDLSYAAAKEIGLVDPGSGSVQMKVVQIGKGEREPPAPYVVQIEDPKEKVIISSEEVPNVAFPLPSQTTNVAPNTDFTVQVEEQRRGVPTRRQVSADGRTIEEVPIGEAAPPPSPATAAPEPAPVTTSTPPPAPRPRSSGKFVVQVGAFSLESNANSLVARLARIGQEAFVDHDTLYRVRLGPFATRELAVKTRSELEASGLSAIIVVE